MRGRFLLFLFALFALGALCWPGRPTRSELAPAVSLRLEIGQETEADRLSLAGEVAERCGIKGPAGITADPFILRADLLPAAGLELALGMEINHRQGLLAIVSLERGSWRLLAYLGPDRLGVPTSLEAVTLPRRKRAALILTEVADQMAGAFTRRELCAFYAADKDWRCLWSREIDTEAFWNRAWEQPPEAGWLQLTGFASWRQARSKDNLQLVVNFQNVLAAGPAGAKLPEAGAFVPLKERRGRELYTWAPRLDLFILRYARTRSTASLMRRRGLAYERLAELPPGAEVVVLVDEANSPGALLGLPRMLRVLAGGRIGYLPAAAVGSD